MSNVAIKITKLLADIELTVSKLYKVYAQKYPEHKDFWEGLVKEEEHHAELMGSLIQQLKKGLIRLDEKRCAENAVRTVLNYVEDHLAKAKRYAVSETSAFLTAFKIEKNVLEKDFCSFFEADTPEFKETCKTITWETEQHRNKIKYMLGELTVSQ